MKKIGAIICVLFLCLSFSACQQQDEVTTTSQVSSQSETTTTVVAVSQSITSSAQEQTTSSESTTAESTTIETTIQTTTFESTTKQTTSAAEKSSTSQVSSVSSEANKQTQTPTSQQLTAATQKAEKATSSAKVTTSAKKPTTTKKAATTAATTKPTTTKPSTTKPTTTQPQNQAYVTIDMTNAKKNIGSLSAAKHSFVPSSGVLLNKTKLEFTKGETVFDLIKRACAQNICTDKCKYCTANGISIEFEYTPMYGSYYIEGVHQIYEMDCGVMSGWMIYVNGKRIETSSSTVEVQNGDDIRLIYSCNMGQDIAF